VSGVSRGIDRVDVVFDEPGLVANAGLIMPATLMTRLGLETLVNMTPLLFKPHIFGLRQPMQKRQRRRDQSERCREPADQREVVTGAWVDPDGGIVWSEGGEERGDGGDACSEADSGGDQ